LINDEGLSVAGFSIHDDCRGRACDVTMMTRMITVMMMMMMMQESL